MNNVGDKVYFRAKTSNTNFSKGYGEKDYYNFVISDYVNCNGNVNYLLEKDGNVGDVNVGNENQLPESAFAKLFYGCAKLKTAPVLPATYLNLYCYQYMFEGCTSLTKAPDLPATGLAGSCYYNMFKGCTLLKSIKIHSITPYNYETYHDWLANTNDSGTIYCTKNFYQTEGKLENGVTNIPAGWTIVHIN